MNSKISQLGDQILKTLDQLPGNDPQTKRVRMHVQALMEALGSPVSDAAMGTSQEPAAEFEGPPVNSRGGGSSPPPPLKFKTLRPGMHTERRATRQAAGVTLKQVAKAAKTTLPTARMYEVKRTAVRPDKRRDLDRVYESLRKPGE
jgi:hypothetical protein